MFDKTCSVCSRACDAHTHAQALYCESVAASVRDGGRIDISSRVYALRVQRDARRHAMAGAR